MNTESIIQINNLSKKFKGFELDISSLELPKGFAIALIGENGAGKSTLMNILSGVRLDYKGAIDYFNGQTDGAYIRENIGYTCPGNYFLPNWSIASIAEVSQILFKQFHKERYEQFCHELGLTDTKKKIKKLSDGMRMKTTLASVFARDTQMLLLDEPASPLDPLMRDKLCSMIRGYLDDGDGQKSVLFSTHNISDMENVTDYAIIMEKGTVVEQGFVEDLKEKYIIVKGESHQFEQAKPYLLGVTTNSFGYEGLCLADDIDKLAGLDIAVEAPSLSQISIAIMKQYTELAV